MSSTKQTRNSLGITLAAFADLLNFTQGQLAMHETGHRIPAGRIANDPAFQRTRENGEEFGRAGAAGKLLRMTFRH